MVCHLIRQAPAILLEEPPPLVLLAPTLFFSPEQMLLLDTRFRGPSPLGVQLRQAGSWLPFSCLSPGARKGVGTEWALRKRQGCVFGGSGVEATLQGTRAPSLPCGPSPALPVASFTGVLRTRLPFQSELTPRGRSPGFQAELGRAGATVPQPGRSPPAAISARRAWGLIAAACLSSHPSPQRPVSHAPEEDKPRFSGPVEHHLQHPQPASPPAPGLSSACRHLALSRRVPLLLDNLPQDCLQLLLA